MSLLSLLAVLVCCAFTCMHGDHDVAFSRFLDISTDELTILVVVERLAEMKKAVFVPSKGKTVLDLIGECGDKDRTNFVDDVRMAATGANTTVEKAPVASEGSNRVVKRADRTLDEFVRTLKSQDDRHGTKIVAAVHKAKKEALAHMKGKTLEAVKRAKPFEETEEAAHQYEVGGHRHVACSGRN